MTLLTIIIPHYNSEASLVRLLDTIPLSSKIQVVVVDDNSEGFDIDSFTETYSSFEFILNTRGKGAGGARNSGLDIAKGAWVTFADSDDYFISNELAKAIGTISSESLNVDIVFFKPSSVFSNDHSKAKRHIKYTQLIENYMQSENNENRVKLLFSHYVPWSKFIRIELIKSNGIYFDETIIANDGMFSAKCSLYAKGINSYQSTFYIVTVSPNSLTRVKNVKYFRVRLEVFTRMYHFLPDKIKRSIGMSPLSLLKMSLSYSLLEFFKTLMYFRKNKVHFFKYLNRTSFMRLYLNNKS